MTKQNYLFLLLLSLVAHTHLQAAQMNVEVKEQEEKIELTAQEQAAADRMFEIIKATNKDNAAQQAQALQKLLLRYPRIVDAKNNHGWTPLMYATRNGHAEIVKLLIAAGAQIDVQDNDGWTPLKNAAFNDYIEIVKLLIAAGAQIDAQDNGGITPLMLAASNGYIEIVKLLIAANAQIDAQDKIRWTPLMYATPNGHAEIVKLLIAANAQIDVQDNDGWTPLMRAAFNGHAEIVQLLITAGAQIDAQDNDGWTPLMRAASKGHAEIVKYLINHGANPNLQDINGMTPLMTAADADEINYNMVRLLVAGEANIDIKNTKDHDKTAFDYTQKPLSMASAVINRDMRYAKAIADGQAEYETNQKNRELQQTEIENFIPVKDLAAIVSSYGYETLPESKKQPSWWDKAKSLASKFYWGKS